MNKTETQKVDELIKEVAELKAIIENQSSTLELTKAWYSLKEACELKGLNYKTSCNKTYLQPKKGIPEGKIGGVKKWTNKTIREWLYQTDSDIGEVC